MRSTRPTSLLCALTTALIFTACSGSGSTTYNTSDSSPSTTSISIAPSAADGAERLLDAASVSLRPTPCEPDVPATTTCGLATVPRDWSTPEGDTTEVFYALLPASSGRSAGTVIPFMGGPGESITAVVDRFVPFAASLPDRDVLIVDVRGAGRSGALTCAAFEQATEFAIGEEQVRRVGECGTQLGEQRDDYTTVASVIDVEAVRRALDLASPSLLGFSYGTWMAQVYTQLFPDEVRATVLDGAFPLDQDPWAEDVPRCFERVLGLRCARTAACPDGAPAVGAAIRSVARSLAERPIDLTGVDQDLTEGAFASLLQFSLQGEDISSLVTAVESAAAADVEGLVALASGALRSPTGHPTVNSPALNAAVSCNDYVAPFELDDDAATRTADLARRLDALPDDAFGWISHEGWTSSGWEQGDMCLDWPRTDIPSELRVPRDDDRPDVPVLVLHGDLDLQTPLAGAEKVAGAFPNSVFVVVPDVAHVTFPVSDCAAALATAFLVDPILPAADACAGEPRPG